MTPPPDEALAASLRRVRDADFREVYGEFPRLHWARRIARLAALVLPFDRHGVGRDMVRAARRGGVAGARRVARSLTRPSGFEMTAVSRSLRCVWIRIPKAASESILAALLAADPECELFRMDYGELYELRPEARDWFAFTFIRHPFGRALSFWSELHFAHERYTERLDFQKRKTARILERDYGLAETRDFSAYCRWLRTPYGADACANKHVVSQSAVLRAAAAGRGRPVDFIGRLESLDADWGRVAARVDAPLPGLPLAHSAAGWKAAPEAVKADRTARCALLTEGDKALLAERYADDLELGGYSPTAEDAVRPRPSLAGAAAPASPRR